MMKPIFKTDYMEILTLKEALRIASSEVTNVGAIKGSYIVKANMMLIVALVRAKTNKDTFIRYIKKIVQHYEVKGT